MARTPVDTKSKLFIKNEMESLDLKNYNFYDSLTPDEKKKFSTYLMLKWGANVYGNSEMQSYYLMSVNENVNKNFFEINKHTKLQWLTLISAMPGIGKQSHYWLASKKKNSDGNKLKKYLLDEFPAMKLDEIDILLQVTDSKEIIKWLQLHGLDEKIIQNLIN